MLFVELRFLFFFAVVFLVTWSLRNNTARKLWLLVVSWFFYACFNFHFAGLLLLSTTVDYTAGMLLSRLEKSWARRTVVCCSLTYNLGLIAFFKYCNFFLGSAETFLKWIGLPASLPTLSILMPVGLSFFTFQSISYTVDVYRRRLEPVRNPLNLATFIAFFPQLVAGPIVRASDFLPQLLRLPKWSDVRVRPAVLLFLSGFLKKAVVAENVAPYVDELFKDPHKYGPMASWLGVLLYAVQIYCDFSGYTDMAIASARLLGYELTVNFRHPYFSASITDFWRRWHISLSTWLRDYLYIPLGGNRNGTFLASRNVLITMLLGGLWHGGAWTFVVWGGLHGCGLLVHRAWRSLLGEWEGGFIHRFLAWIATVGFVCITWILFRAPTLAGALTTIQKCLWLDRSGKTVLPYGLWYLLGGLLAAHALTWTWPSHRKTFERIPAPVFAAGAGALAALLLLLVPAGYRPFIYFQF